MKSVTFQFTTVYNMRHELAISRGEDSYSRNTRRGGEEGRGNQTPAASPEATSIDDWCGGGRRAPAKNKDVASHSNRRLCDNDASMPTLYHCTG